MTHPQHKNTALTNDDCMLKIHGACSQAYSTGTSFNFSFELLNMPRVQL